MDPWLAVHGSGVGTSPVTAIADVIIPTFNQAPLTIACLRSLAAMREPERIRVLWIDNGSDDAQWREVERELGALRLRHLDVPVGENLGFVKATNIGLALSTAPYVVFLNNDTECPPDWLDKLLEVLEKQPTVGAVGPRSSSPHQWQGQISHDGVWGEAPCALLGDHQMLAFFCTMFRREAIVQCGYLSEEYAMGLGDDDDFCAKLQQAGWRLAIRLDLTVLHHHRATFKDVFGEGGWDELQAKNLAHFKRKWGR